MFDTNYDPYQAMINMDTNINNLIKAHNNLARLVEQHESKIIEQGHIIDILIEGLNNSNKANEVLMREMATTVMDKIKEVK